MTNKAQKIREEVERLKSQLLRGACSSQIAMETRCKEEAYNEVLAILDSMQEEPVSEDLEIAANEWNAKASFTPFYMALDDKGNPDGVRQDYTTHAESFKAGAKWQQEKEYTCYEEAFEDGAKWKVENLWKPADGDDLPEIDREVIALLDNGKVGFAHRPNPNGWDGKSLTTGEVEHYIPKTYGKGGWNIPDVKFWLDCLMPKEIEL